MKANILASDLTVSYWTRYQGQLIHPEIANVLLAETGAAAHTHLMAIDMTNDFSRRPIVL